MVPLKALTDNELLKKKTLAKKLSLERAQSSSASASAPNQGADEEAHISDSEGSLEQDSESEDFSDSSDFASPKRRKVGNSAHLRKKRDKENDTSAVGTDVTDPILMSILPLEYKYKCKTLEKYDDPQHIKAEVRANIFSKEEALKWLRLYEDKTKLNFRDGAMKQNRSRVLFKKRFRCHHDTRASEPCSKTKKPHKKHTNCKAVLIITVKNTNMPRSKDPFLKEFPCNIYLKHTHNHNINCADALRFRRPYEEMEEHFIKMFKRQHSPSSALESLKFDLQEEYGNDYFRVSADGAKCPNLQWVFNLYYNHFDKVYGATNGKEMLQSLQEYVAKYNDLKKMKCAVVEEFKGEIVLTLCTPMMKRVLTNLKSTGEIMFVDSSGCMDRHNSRVFLMLSPSVAGALPVGVMIMSSEAEICIKRGLELFLDLIPNGAFAGRGRLGPRIIMTDDSKYERGALRDAFPSAILLLCLFHVFQAFWRYLWDSKHGVSKDDRPYIYYQFKDCGYAKSEEQFGSLYSKMIEDEITEKYSDIVKHLDLYKVRASEWALCHRRDIMIRGHHTDNYAEANIKVIKTKILNRIKAFNIPQLFDFLSRKLEAYFERRISAVINNRVDNYTASRYFINEDKLKPLSCSKIQRDLYLVKNSEKNTEYTVDAALEICTCEAGVGGALCKHLYAVVKQYNLSSSQVLPFADPASKVNLHFIMTGSKIDDEFFQNLISAATNEAAGPAYYSPLAEDLVDSENVIDSNFGEQGQGVNNESEANYEDDEDLFQAEDHETRCSKLDEMVSILKAKSHENSSVAACVDKFLGRFFEECSTGSALEHALSTFNRYRGTKPLQNARSLERAKVTRNMSVNSAAVARRKLPIGGRNSNITGRPSKQFRLDHDMYSQGPSQPAWLGPPKRRQTAPQNLAECVSRNVPLGRTCTKKMN